MHSTGSRWRRPAHLHLIGGTLLALLHLTNGWLALLEVASRPIFGFIALAGAAGQGAWIYHLARGRTEPES